MNTVRFVTAADFVRALISLYQGKQSTDKICHLIHELKDLPEIENSVNLLVDANREEVVFTLINKFGCGGSEGFAETFIVQLFRRAFCTQKLQIALRLIHEYPQNLQALALTLVPFILKEMREHASQMSFKLSILQFFGDQMSDECSEMAVSTLQTIAATVRTREGLLAQNINPFLVLQQLQHLCHFISNKFAKTQMRLKKVRTQLHDTLNEILNQDTPLQGAVKYITWKDLNHKSVMHYITDLDQYATIQSDVVDRLTNDVWYSKYPRTGSFLSNSTSYQVIFKSSLHENQDVNYRRQMLRPV